MKNLFILSYRGANLIENELDSFLSALTDTNIYIVDNGQQIWNKYKSKVIYTTQKNIGCAGGWNLICDIAFKHLHLDTLVISNDDNIMVDGMIDKLYELANPNTVVGTYDRSFEFSLFAITKQTYETVGRFDENFIYATCEDGDYKYRCKLLGIDIKCLNVSADLNKSFNCRLLGSDVRSSNEIYLDEKWGKPRVYTLPFNGTKEVVPRDVVVAAYGESSLWPSELEYINFWTKHTIDTK